MDNILTYTRAVIQTNQYDPTHTTAIRTAFVREVRRRFRELTRVIRQAVVEEDCFGIAAGFYQLSPPGRQAFAFPRSADKLRAFEDWIQTQIDRGLLEVRTLEQVGTGIEGAWTNRYVYDSYKRGVQRARYELQKAGFGVPTIEQTGGIDISMSTPFHIDRLGLLYTRTFSELRNITAQMDQQISRVLAQGLADGDGPQLLARKLVGTINGAGMGDLALTDTLGRFIPAGRRVEIMARTEVIRAHHQATVQEYRNWAVEGVVVKAEWMSAGDERVCNRCADLQGSVFTLDEIEKMIPLHPQCRCIALPYKEGVPAKEVIDPLEWREVSDPKELSEVLYEKYKMNITERALRSGGKSAVKRTNVVADAVGNQIIRKFDKFRKNPEWFEFYLQNVPYVENRMGVLGTYERSYRSITIAQKSVVRTAGSLNTVGQHNIAIDLASIARHEYGHHVYYQVLSSQQRIEWIEFFKEIKPTFRTRVSQYAMTNASEAFAESFSAYTSPLYNQSVRNKSIPINIRTQLEKLIGKRIDL